MLRVIPWPFWHVRIGLAAALLAAPGLATAQQPATSQPAPVPLPAPPGEVPPASAAAPIPDLLDAAEDREPMPPIDTSEPRLEDFIPLPGDAGMPAEPLPAEPPEDETPPVAGGTPATEPGAPIAASGLLAWPNVETTTELGGEQVVSDVRYAVTLSGLDALKLEEDFKSLSALWANRNNSANLAQINRRVIEDRQLIDQLLRSIGHYGGNTTAEVIPPVRSGDPVQVTLGVEPGPRYTFQTLDVSPPVGSKLAPAMAPLARGLLGIRAGDAVDAARVNALEDALPGKLADAGYPFPQVNKPEIVVDHATRTATLVQTVDPGARGVFGRNRIEGQTQGFDEKHMAVISRFKPGQTYNGADREDLRQALVQTGLFGSVSTKPVLVGEPRADGTILVDVVATVEAAPTRSVAATGGYSTGQGFRVEASWAHRNLLPPEGGLIVRGVASEREQLLAADLRRRNWRQRDQNLSFGALISREQQLAFRANSVQLTARLDRESNIVWQKPITYSVGVAAIATRQLDRSLRLVDEDPNATYFILAVPGSVTWDQSDDLLNPSRGFRLTARVAPEFTLRSGTSFNYVKAELEGSVYQPFAGTVLAARLHFGTIYGANRGRIAPSRRFYAGGGGSVRGFDFQGVGPKDITGAPTGGNSLTEASFEARFRFKALGSDIGIVPFIDAGQVSEGTTPGFKNLKVGAGIGLRYYTSFGPVRIDVATPITRDPGDPKVAFYVSIGQAF